MTAFRIATLGTFFSLFTQERKNYRLGKKWPALLLPLSDIRNQHSQQPVMFVEKDLGYLVTSVSKHKTQNSANCDFFHDLNCLLLQKYFLLIVHLHFDLNL